MTERRLLIVGNWKMHLNTGEASLLVHRIHERIKTYRSIEVVLAPSLLTLQPLSLQIDRRKFRLAAQNAYFKDEGAFTGEVSFSMLRDLVHYCIIGHSERRLYFHEDLEMIRDKIKAAVRNDITPILCVGETQAERKAGETNRVLHDQVVSALSDLTTKEVGEMVIAYEPVWAISTFGGILAKPIDVSLAFEHIRKQVRALFGEATAKKVRVLYGGSVDDATARGYMEVKGCDGVLVGGASIHYQKFSGIIESAYRMLHEKSNK